MRIENWKEFNDSLIKTGTPYTVEKTSLSIKFITPYGKFDFYTTNENTIPAGELFFIKRVKDYAETLDLKFTVDRGKIKYIDLPRYAPDWSEENVIEIDLSAAYWHFAHEIGIISDEIFDTGKNGYINKKGEQKYISKKTRLASLGALSKLTYNLTFDGEKWNLPTLTESPKADYFFKVAEQTGEIMSELKHICGADFLFFWVDAIFFFPNSQTAVENFLNLNGLNFKKYKIEKLISRAEYLQVYSEQHKEEKKAELPTRRFYYKHDNNFDVLDKHTKKQRKRK